MFLKRLSRAPIRYAPPKFDFHHAFIMSARAYTSLFTAICLLWTITNQSLAAGDFALRDGDKVVFLGDSITAARGYTKVVENYTLLRYPQRKVRFLNAGQGGDTAEGALKRLERDVLDQGATVVTVAFGINDIGWGMRANEDSKQRYLAGIRGIVETCHKRGVRVFICSPAITAEEPDKAEQGFLQKMTDEGMALARSLGAGSIDLQREMRAIQRRIVEANAKETDAKKLTRLHTEDGIHLNDLGQLAMGFAMIKGLGAPAEVSSVVIDAATGKLETASGCQVSRIKKVEQGIDFTRLDEGLPLNFGIFGGLNFRFIPIPDQISRYLLTVRNLPPGDYELRAGGRLLGKTTHQRLAEGMNISFMTGDPWQPGGPWDAQAGILRELTDARDLAWMGKKLRNDFLNQHPADRKLDRQADKVDEEIIQLQRATVQPYPYQFEIRKVP